MVSAIQFRSALFWDTDPKSLDVQKHSKYIIERIMDFGNDDEVRWMRQHYSKDVLAKVCQSSKQLHTSSRNFWTLLTA